MAEATFYWHGFFRIITMGKLFILLLLFFFAACTLPEKKRENQLSKSRDTAADTSIIETSNAYTAAVDTASTVALPAVRKIKAPSGIYQAVFPLDNKMEQTILFNKDLTYRLQEKYFIGKKDSVSITEGTWTPSDGFIWLYKDQIVRGRYKWKGDTLQYFSPQMKKNFSMSRLPDATENKAWRNKEKQGVLVFAVGNEPFWNIELNNRDSISFLLAEWEHPLQMKIDSSFTEGDGVAYIAHHDSAQLHVTVFPHFCSDGMSDFIYRNSVKVQYNQQVYSGCGIVYQQ